MYCPRCPSFQYACQEQIEDYLLHLKKKGASEADFKLTVFGLKFLFRIEGLDDQAIKLSSIKHEKKFPAVLSTSEVKTLLTVATLLKHRVLIAMAADFRCHEVRALLIKDVDFNRNMIHVRQGKGRKDRYVPIGTYLSRGLKKYFDEEQPVKWRICLSRTGYRFYQGTSRPCAHRDNHGVSACGESRKAGTLFAPGQALRESLSGASCFEVADVINAHWQDILRSWQFNTWQLETLDAIRRCVANGHVDLCTSCGHTRISYTRV